jgi:hypothetical protein
MRDNFCGKGHMHTRHMYTTGKNPQLEIVELAYRGMVHVDERARSVDDVLRLLDATGFHRVLADFTHAVIPVDDFASSAALARKMSDNPQLHECRLACVSAPETGTNHVVDGLAVARGLTIEKFRDRAEAIRWLMADAKRTGTG